MDKRHPPPSSLISLAMEAAHLEQALMGSDDPEAMLETVLAQIETDLAYKADHYHYAMDRIKGTADMLKARAEEFEKAAKVLSNAQTRMKDRIKTAMQIMGKTEIRGSDIVFKLTTPTQRIVIDADRIPLEYLMTEVIHKPDRAKIEADIAKGIVIEGVQVFESHTLRVSVNKERGK